MKLPSSIFTGCSLASPITSAAMAMRWSIWVATQAAAGGAALAVHDEVIPLDFGVDGVGAQQCGGGGETIGIP